MANRDLGDQFNGVDYLPETPWPVSDYMRCHTLVGLQNFAA